MLSKIHENNYKVTIPYKIKAVDNFLNYLNKTNVNSFELYRIKSIKIEPYTGTLGVELYIRDRQIYEVLALFIDELQAKSPFIMMQNSKLRVIILESINKEYNKQLLDFVKTLGVSFVNYIKDIKQTKSRMIKYNIFFKKALSSISYPKIVIPDLKSIDIGPLAKPYIKLNHSIRMSTNRKEDQSVKERYDIVIRISTKVLIYFRGANKFIKDAMSKKVLQDFIRDIVLNRQFGNILRNEDNLSDVKNKLFAVKYHSVIHNTPLEKSLEFIKFYFTSSRGKLEFTYEMQFVNPEIKQLNKLFQSRSIDNDINLLTQYMYNKIVLGHIAKFYAIYGDNQNKLKQYEIELRNFLQKFSYIKNVERYIQ